MSRVARSARVASRQRPEIITESKTIQTAETGELFLINYNEAANITLTLPSVQDGAYFRFQFMQALSATTGSVTISSADGAGSMKGTMWNMGYSASSNDVPNSTNKDNSSTSIFFSGSSLLGNSTIEKTHVGSYVDIYCDGSNWYASGVCIGGHLSQSVFI